MDLTEKGLAELVENTKGLTWGYIGNFERWGDDRMLFIWVDGLYYENGNTKNIWSCGAKGFAGEDFRQAWRAVKAFEIGRESGLAAAEAG